MNLIEIERVVSKLQAHLFKKANSYSVGLFKSKFKGSGIQFREHQIYAPGDDVRFIDWKLSAKSADKTYIKTFEEERNVEIVTIIDISPTMFTGFNYVSKLQMALEVSCLIYLLAEESKDYQKVILLSEKAVDLPKLTGKKGIVSLVSHLEKKGFLREDGKVRIDGEYNSKMDPSEKIKTLKSYLARKKEVILLSDFYDSTFLSEINKLIGNKNLNVFKLVSPLDKNSSSPYSFKSVSSSGSGFSFFRGEKQKVEVDKKIKRLNIESKYLEDFVKEMI